MFDMQVCYLFLCTVC